jgi:murein DD-endopeptidase
VWNLIYELHLTNLAGLPLTVDRIHVESDDGALHLGTFEGLRLEDLLGQPGLRAGTSASRTFAPGLRTIVYFNIPLSALAGLRTIRHKVDVTTADAREPLSLVGGSTPLDTQVLPRLSPPLRGGPWAAVYDPALQQGHRRVFYTVDGRARIPGRFAIDWFKIDGQGRSLVGAAGQTTDSLGYGADVLAVADAVVAATRDNFPEPQTLAGIHRVAIGDATGNYVALDLGHGRFAFYEHLKPGLRVKPGDRVSTGQVIAALGFTGQTTSPHLHFHVSDANAPLAAEGRPFHLDHVEELGSFSSLDAFDRGDAWRRGSQSSRDGYDLPGPQVVVHFA